MTIWQSDLYHYPVTEPQWRLVICDSSGKLIHETQIKSSQVNAEWLQQELLQAGKTQLPEKIQIFRPQIIGLFQLATENLGIKLETTRRTKALKEKLKDYFPTIFSQNYLGIDRPAPQPLPEDIWGENWNFVSITAGDLINFISDRPMPIKEIPESLFPVNLGLASTTIIPGILVYGGRKSLILARWLQQQQPISLDYIPTEIGKSGGLVLESGLIERWVFATFESEAVAQAASSYEQQKQNSKGLHFLLLQPDDSGMTHTGFYLLMGSY